MRSRDGITPGTFSSPPCKPDVIKCIEQEQSWAAPRNPMMCYRRQISPDAATCEPPGLPMMLGHMCVCHEMTMLGS